VFRKRGHRKHMPSSLTHSRALSTIMLLMIFAQFDIHDGDNVHSKHAAVDGCGKWSPPAYQLKLDLPGDPFSEHIISMLGDAQSQFVP
jgi:hypothetical protein